MSSILVFYGFSGSPKEPVPSFPDGVDYDRSYQLAAETLGSSIKKLFPTDNVHVRQAWTKDAILRALETASESIRQVYIVAHADSTRLALACRYDGNARLRKSAVKHNAVPRTDTKRAIEAMKDDDALIAGFFANALEELRLATIKSNHVNGASWQIWGCYAGYASDTFRGIGDADIDPYLERFNFDLPTVPGIAVDIAKSLGVTCTAARDGLGLEFWRRMPTGKVVRNDTRTPANPPFWLWPTRGSRWVSFDPSGKPLPRPLIFEQPRKRPILPTARPPRWLTDLF